MVNLLYTRTTPRQCSFKFLGGDFKNKQTTKQLFEKEHTCSNNFLKSETIIISIKFHQEYNCFIINMNV